jgi:hypothetical protein
MAKLSKAAKLTQRIYGTSRYEAVLDTLWNLKIVSIIAPHSRIISIRASKGFLRPKKRIDQSVLSASCRPNTTKAILKSLGFAFLLQTRYNEMPISIYSKVHTGPNSQLGGLKKGLFKVRYQVETEEAVDIEPMKPADRQIIIDAASFQ